MKIRDFVSVSRGARIVLKSLKVEITPYQDTGLCWGFEIPRQHQDLFEVTQSQWENRVDLSPWGKAILCDLAQKGLEALEMERAEATLL